MLKLSGCPRLTWGRVSEGAASPPLRLGLGSVVPLVRRKAGSPACRSVSVHHSPCSVQPTARTSPRRTARHGGAVSASASAPALPSRRRSGGVRSDARRDAQAGVPSAEWPRAQLAFKDSMVHGILQFTPSIAFRYVLHRCESRDIRCRESYNSMCISWSGRVALRRSGARRFLTEVFLGARRAGVLVSPPVPGNAEGGEAGGPGKTGKGRSAPCGGP